MIAFICVVWCLICFYLPYLTLHVWQSDYCAGLHCDIDAEMIYCLQYLYNTSCVTLKTLDRMVYILNQMKHHDFRLSLFRRTFSLSAFLVPSGHRATASKCYEDVLYLRPQRRLPSNWIKSLNHMINHPQLAVPRWRRFSFSGLRWHNCML